MWELDHKESGAQRNWRFWIVVLQKTLESPLDCKEIKPIHPKGNQPCIFIGKTSAVTSKLWPPDSKSRFIGKDPDAENDWRQKEKGAAEDKMVRQHHRLNGHGFGETPRNSEREKSPECSSPWVTVRHDLMTEQQKWQWDFGRVAAWQDGRKYFWSNWQPSCPCGKTPRRKKEPTAHTQYSGKISVMLLESTESAEGLSTLGLLCYKR